MRLTSEQLEAFVKPVIEAQTDPTLEPINADHLIGSWRVMMESGTGVAYGSDAGFLLGLHCTDLMTGKRKAFEYLWMVHPEKRAGSSALKLLVEFEDGAKFDGCVSVVVGNSSGYKPEALARLYRRAGYAQISQSFQKHLVRSEEK